jgi:hypothetical protein
MNTNEIVCPFNLLPHVWLQFLTPTSDEPLSGTHWYGCFAGIDGYGERCGEDRVIVASFLAVGPYFLFREHPDARFTSETKELARPCSPPME